MAHHHSHNHSHGVNAGQVGKVLAWGILLNFLYVVFEAIAGFHEGSLGLLSDAGHNLSDVFSLALSWIAIGLAHIPSNRNFTYGYKKAGILIALVNALLLLVAVGAIVAEAVRNLKHPSAIDGSAVSIVAGIGIIVNALTAFLLMRHSKGDVNIKGAFLHMAADALVSVGVVVAGLIIHFTGWTLIDPIMSLVVAAIILISTFELCKDSLMLLLDAVPESVDRDAVVASIEGNGNVASWHHLHIWALGTTETAMTIHLVLKDLNQMEQTKTEIRSSLKEMGITHPTIEIESSDADCHDTCCG